MSLENTSSETRVQSKRDLSEEGDLPGVAVNEVFDSRINE